MVEIRISSAQGTISRSAARRESEVFVFDDESDAVLVQRWQRGDLAAASIAIQRHEAMAYAAVFRLLRNHALSEDVCQDAFLRAHLRITSLRQPGAFRGWLRKIAVRLAVEELRRRSEDELTGFEPDTRPGPESVVETLDALERFRIQLDALPPTQRSVVVLRDVEGFSIRETAEQLDISEGAVKMRLSRARAALLQNLEPRQEDTGE